MGIDGIISGGIQGIAAIGGAIARRRAMKKAMQEVENSAKEQQANIDAANAKEQKIENQNGMQLASTQKTLSAINNVVANRRKQNRALASMGMMSEGTAKQLSEGDETAQLASNALVNQQNRADAAVKSQEALMGEKNNVIGSKASQMANLYKSQADAVAQAVNTIGQQAGGMIKKS